MQYLVTAKIIKDDKPAKQEIWNAHDTLNFVRKVFAQAGSEETCADIQALALMQKVDDGSAQVMRNGKNKHVIVIQLHVNTE